MPDEKTIDRMLKIKAHAESARNIGSEAEAQAFAERLNQMLVEHRMSMSDLEDKAAQEEPLVNTYFRPDDDGVEVKQKKDAPLWLHGLGFLVARMNACAHCGVRDTNWIGFRGRAADAVNAKLSMIYLAQAAMRLAMRSYREKVRIFGTGTELTKGYKESFLYGFVTRIEERMKESRAKMEQGQQLGLVRVNRDLARAEKSLEEEPGVVEEKFERSGKINPIAFVEGMDEANRQQLKKAGTLTA